MISKKNILLIIFGVIVSIFGFLMSGHPYIAGMIIAIPFVGWLVFFLYRMSRQREKETEDCC